jgi:hypothetical protein
MLVAFLERGDSVDAKETRAAARPAVADDVPAAVPVDDSVGFDGAAGVVVDGGIVDRQAAAWRSSSSSWPESIRRRIFPRARSRASEKG